jgi:hypothetical protein
MLARAFGHRSRDVTVVCMPSTSMEQHVLERHYRRLF